MIDPQRPDDSRRVGIAMVKKNLIAYGHLPHEISGLIIPYAVPGCCLFRGTGKVFDRKYARFRFHEPISPFLQMYSSSYVARDQLSERLSARFYRFFWFEASRYTPPL